MLTIHDCTFQVSWKGWGPFTVHAERVAVDIMVELQEMSPEGVQRLARSPRELNLTGRVARARLSVILAHRNRVTPKHADIVLEAL